MNLLGLLLPDFSARVCGRSISARLFSCQGRVDFSGLRVLRRTLLPPPLWNTPSFIIDRSQEFSGGRGLPRALAPRSRRLATAPIARSVFRRNRLLRSGVSRSASLATVGGEISILDQLRVVGDLPL